MAASYQLPDLLSLTSKFDLRTNKHCRSVTLDSERWLACEGPDIHRKEYSANMATTTVASTCHPILDPRDREKIPRMKVGLLASLCIPTCDSPQLRLVVDFWNLLMCENEKIMRGIGPVKLGWDGEEAEQQSTADFIQIMERHAWYRCLIPRFRSMIQMRTSPLWQKRFSESLLALRDAQFTALKYRENGIVLPVDEYMDLRRDLSGLQLIFDLVEAAEGLNIDEVEGLDDLIMMRRLAADIIVASWDVFLYNVDQSLDRKLNLVAIIMAEYGIGISGAILQAGTWIKQKFDAFAEHEKAFLSHIKASDPISRADAPPAGSRSSWWQYFNFGMSTPTSLGTDGEATTITITTRHDVLLFVQGLRDCIGGSVNWAYESEIFFGTKGDSVRGFGWVFLLPKQELDSIE